VHGVSPPTEAVFRLAGIAVTEGQADLGLEEATLMACQALGSKAEQFIVLLLDIIHGSCVRDENLRT
jgi:hypothetical protein